MLSAKAGKVVSAEVQSDMETKLNLITKHAAEDRSFKFTSLAHLLNEESLKECFHMLKKDRAPGVDNVTYEEYEKYLNTNVQKLVKKMKAGKYHPQPVRRAYIPKGEGKMRPLGIPALEDKIVQMGVTRILNAIFEPNFLDCSYGFRTGRSCHQALKQIDNTIMTKPVNHIIDADIRSFFDNVDHDWLMKMLEEKIADKNFLRIIKKFLKAGVMEERLNKFGLDLSKEKTRLIEFGRYARANAERKGRKPDTFDFLGFTHFCDKSRKGNFKVGRKTRGKKFNVKLKEMNDWLRSVRNMVEIKEWWKVLVAKIRGHYEYYGISGNYTSLMTFYKQACKLAYKWINRRSQKKSMNWKQFMKYLEQFPLPKPEIKHSIYILGGNV